MPLSNAMVARLASGDPCDEVCGLLLICNWPASEELQQRYTRLRQQLASTLPSCAYLYPPSTLHCTVATLRPFTGAELDPSTRDAECTRWRAVLDAARAMPEWPEASATITLRLGPPTLEGAAGIVRYEEVGGGCMAAMRACLNAAIAAAGGRAAEGGGDRSQCLALPGAPPHEPPPHLPNIIHSTVLRWASEPSEEEVAASHAAFKAAAASWEPLVIDIAAGSVVGVVEDRAFMHIPHGDDRVFWSASGPG
jgi:hypothetical protein